MFTTMPIKWATAAWPHTPENITSLSHNHIFVYGANESFYHGAGAALKALEFGAVMRNGPYVGDTYGICTKSKNVKDVLPNVAIQKHVTEMLYRAASESNKVWAVTKIGCGYDNPYGRGKKAEKLRISEIAPMFRGHTPNVILPIEFQEYLKK